MAANRPAPGRFPLRPGKPLVFRCRRRGVWGFICDCLSSGRHGAYGTESPNRGSHADALAKAIDHVRFAHRSPRELELAALEAAFAAPAAERPAMGGAS